MSVNFIYKKFFLLPSLSSQSFNQILRLFLLSLIVSTHSVQANEENTESFVTDFKVLTEDNLPEYVSRMSQHYYEQVESLGSYFQLYQQKRDPRGFNVWHLRGFSPTFNTLNDESQQVAKANEEFLTGRPEQALSTIFAELKEVSVHLMLSFRENDPEAFKLADAKVKEHGEQIATLLRSHNLETEIREVSLN